MPDSVNSRRGVGNITQRELGVIETLRSVGMSAASIAEALGRSESAIYRSFAKINSDDSDSPLQLSQKIRDNIAPLAMLRHASFVLGDDEDLAYRASKDVLRGSGVYSEHVMQTSRPIPDSEITAGLTELLMDALTGSAIEADYTTETSAKEAINDTETTTATLPPTIEEQAQEVRKSGDTIGKLVAETNAKRLLNQGSKVNSIRGATQPNQPDEDERA